MIFPDWLLIPGDRRRLNSSDSWQLKSLRGKCTIGDHCRVLSKHPDCSRIYGEYDACNEALIGHTSAMSMAGRRYDAAGEKKPRLSPTDRFAVKDDTVPHTGNDCLSASKRQTPWTGDNIRSYASMTAMCGYKGACPCIRGAFSG